MTRLITTSRKQAISLSWLNPAEFEQAQQTVKAHHYLHSRLLTISMPGGYLVRHTDIAVPIGLLLFNRPQAQSRCQNFYGSVEDVAAHLCKVTRWQVINLARVWFSPSVQPGGEYHHPDLLPGYLDKGGVWHSTLASTAINLALSSIGFDYLRAFPPVFIEEPYQIRYCISYCNSHIHQGTLYRASGFELFNENNKGIQTYRKGIKPLTDKQIAAIEQASRFSLRSQKKRGARLASQSQLVFDFAI